MSRANPYYRDQVVVLMYHQLGPIENRITITPERFKRHLDILNEKYFTIIDMSAYLNFLQGGSVPPNAVLLTFDDGYETFYTTVYPELKRRNVTATNFVVGKLIDDPGNAPHLPYDPINDMPHLTWDQMREMKKDGMSFLNHTYDLHYYFNQKVGLMQPALSSFLYLEEKGRFETIKEYNARVQSDLTLAERRLQEELGAQPPILCFPYGEYNETLLQLCERMGFKLFFTCKEGINKPGNKEVCRLDAGNGTVTPEQLMTMIKKYIV